ncbi:MULTISPECIES: hypothetical protein [unclassified Microcoleus]|uniref:hypothetical protein n=1 Tax=unclassified Microcoleus TaxID=2642155 RepID=UPI002FD33410
MLCDTPRVWNVGSSELCTGRSTIALVPLRLKVLARVNLGARLQTQPPKIQSKAEGIRVQCDKNATNRQ